MKNKDEEDKDSKSVLFIKNLKIISNLDVNWYMDNATLYYITYNKSVFILFLDHTLIVFEMVNSKVLIIQGMEVIRLPVWVGEVEDWIIILDVNYCLDATSNLLSIGKFVKKGCWYIDKKKKLKLYHLNNDIVFEGTLTSDDIYVLSLHGDKRSKSLPVFLKISQIISKKRAYCRMGYMYYGGFSDLLKNVDRLFISPGSLLVLFCETYIFNKQTKSYNKEPVTRTKDPDKRWHVDLIKNE